MKIVLFMETCRLVEEKEKGRGSSRGEDGTESEAENLSISVILPKNILSEIL